MRKIYAIGASNVRRMLRERSNIFFVFIFPIALILLIGAQFGGDFAPGVGIYQADDDPLATAISDEIRSEDSLAVTMFETPDDLTHSVERGGVQAGVLILDATHRDELELVGWVRLPGQSGEVTVDRDRRLLYVSGLGGGIYVIDFDEPPSTAMLDASTTAIGSPT